MDNFANVSPLPFQTAQLPFALLGRAFAPQLPAVGGYDAADLERMRFLLMQSGADPAMLGRINEVMSMRGTDVPALDGQLLRPKKNAVGWRKHNPFDVAADAMQQ